MSNLMNYSLFDLFERSLAPFHQAAECFAASYKALALPTGNRIFEELWAEYECVAIARVTHDRPEFHIESCVDHQGKLVPISTTEVARTPFAKLLRLHRENEQPGPKILLVAPMSGHFSTLLAGTVQTLVQDHDVYLTDWINPRDIKLAEGCFGFDDYVDHVIQFLHALGSDVHLMAVCQPAVACLAAAALMAEQSDPCEPSSLILMAGPIDTRQNPTRVNVLAKERPIEWFERNMISLVPMPYRGCGRMVYPGVLQLTAFMSMNKERHMAAFKQLKELRRLGDHSRADAIAKFYAEYFAVMDLPAAFYIETVNRVFQEHQLPLKTMRIRGQKVDCSAIRRPFLLTIEGERDDICGVGQTLAAQELCNRMPLYKKTHHLQPGVGHYGVFNGKRWEKRIYPVIRSFVQSIH